MMLSWYVGLKKDHANLNQCRIAVWRRLGRLFESIGIADVGHSAQTTLSQLAFSARNDMNIPSEPTNHPVADIDLDLLKGLHIYGNG